MMTSPKPIAAAAAAALLAAGLVAGGPVTAQAQQSQGQADAAQYEKAELEAFVTAAKKIRTVLDEFAPQMEAAGSDAERAAVEKAANREVVAAVKSTDGITLERYSEIARAARDDRALYDRIANLMAES